MLAILGASLALGIRHGIDWDHIAAITDITSTTTAPVERSDDRDRVLSQEPGVQLTDESHHPLMRVESHARASLGEPAPQLAVAAAGAGSAAGALTLARPSRRGFVGEQRKALLLGTLYALGHGFVVFVLGLLAILAAEVLPDWIDPIMERVVGVTLILLSVYLFYSLYRYFRGGEEFRMRSRWMLVFAAVGTLYHRLVAKLQGRRHTHHVQPAQQYGSLTAFGIGMIHGVGAETGTQALIIAAAAGATSKGVAVVTLIVFIVGLLISNSFVTIATTTGFVSARERQTIYVVVGAVAAVFSLALGLLYLFGSGGILPDLDPYFRWIGGPES